MESRERRRLTHIGRGADDTLEAALLGRGQRATRVSVSRVSRERHISACPSATEATTRRAGSACQGAGWLRRQAEEGAGRYGFKGYQCCSVPGALYLSEGQRHSSAFLEKTFPHYIAARIDAARYVR
uniref:Uncharacterized protein n=1 Tax=Mycena chlorophos TaxID=658473 RepID=A0ABQ0KZM3_MYCCL|nr:predicted protein [Mycena chlorophos]